MSEASDLACKHRRKKVRTAVFPWFCLHRCESLGRATSRPMPDNQFEKRKRTVKEALLRDLLLCWFAEGRCYLAKLRLPNTRRKALATRPCGPKLGCIFPAGHTTRARVMLKPSPTKLRMRLLDESSSP